MKQDMEIGYGLHPDHWGQGYITEAAELICEYLFQRYPIEKITAYTNLDNLGSQRVLEKCGFQNVGKRIKNPPPAAQLTACIGLNAIARNTNACRLVPARVLTYATKRKELEAQP
jgi:RimJ/RimL family protein N-acetyltransferase